MREIVLYLAFCCAVVLVVVLLIGDDQPQSRPSTVETLQPIYMTYAPVICPTPKATYPRGRLLTTEPEQPRVMHFTSPGQGDWSSLFSDQPITFDSGFAIDIHTTDGLLTVRWQPAPRSTP